MMGLDTLTTEKQHLRRISRPLNPTDTDTDHRRDHWIGTCSYQTNMLELHGFRMNTMRVMRISGIRVGTAAERDRDQLVVVEVGAKDDGVAKQVDPLGHTLTISLG